MHDRHLNYRDQRPPTDERIPVFGWDACKLSRLTFEQLHELRHRIETDPKNWNYIGCYLFIPTARRKLDKLAWSITYKLQEQKRNRHVHN